jgi:hypothetical protein
MNKFLIVRLTRAQREKYAKSFATYAPYDAPYIFHADWLAVVRALQKIRGFEDVRKRAFLRNILIRPRDWGQPKYEEFESKH